MNWIDLEQAAIGFAATALTIATPILVNYVRQRTNSAILADAVQAGGGVAYNALVAAHSGGATPDWHAAKAAAVDQGVAAASQLLQRDVSPALVAGALGKLLATDPTVNAGPTSAASATALEPMPTMLSSAGNDLSHAAVSAVADAVAGKLAMAGLTTAPAAAAA